ncbi:FAD binding domain-containing protein [Hysterangium stoloniferum]|nr:FAD binding domain-containing protein [Hysterangium stoloniferum]
MAQKESNIDVLIIGAGPAGLMFANGLAKFGVNVRIIDQRPLKIMAGQADGIQPRTIEVLQSYGLAERLIREGNQMHLAAFYNPSPNGGIERTGRTSDVSAPTARFPFEVTLHQGAIEALFLDSMSARGLQVERPIRPVSLEISGDPEELANPQSYSVTAVLECQDSDEIETVHAKYVLGADGIQTVYTHGEVRINGRSSGAHSWPWWPEHSSTDFIWGVVDGIPDTDFPDIRNKSVIHSNNGSCMVIPREGDKVRLYIQLAEADVITNGRVDKNKIDDKKLIAVAKKSLAPYSLNFPDVEWWTIYIIGQRVASSFSKHNRVFIAGDACHTHSPKAGQGMNASMNDTHNLSWKLTQVLRGWADPSILTTYEFERRKFAQDLINFDRKFSALFSGKPRTSDNENGVTHEEFLAAFQTSGGFTSGIGIHYNPSPITNTKYQAFASNLPIGERMIPQVLIRAADGRSYELQDLLPADVRFKLLIFTGNTRDKAQLDKLHTLAGALEPTLLKYVQGEKIENMFEILSISTASKEDVEYTVLPKIMRHHWSKVFVDQKEVHGTMGGTAYTTYGILPAGAIVVIRPDGYVGTVAPLDDPDHVDEYFGGFLKR